MPGIISEAYSSSRMFSNMSNVAEIISELTQWLK